jgi:hypothetical protein
VNANLFTGVITFTVSTSATYWRYSPGRQLNVHGWFDWDHDGDWNDPGEFVINWSGYPGDGVWPAGTPSIMIVYTIPVPTNPANTIWVRFRLDYAQNLESVTGPANFGEVEDYRLLLFRLRLPMIFYSPAP